MAEETIVTSETGGMKAIRLEDYSQLHGTWLAKVMVAPSYVASDLSPMAAALKDFGCWQERLPNEDLPQVGRWLIAAMGDEARADRADANIEELRDGLDALARVAVYGSTKYERFNWKRGYPWSSSIASFWRHVVAHLSGERVDPESGQPHLAHALWHVMTLYAFGEVGLGEDDRWRGAA